MYNIKGMICAAWLLLATGHVLAEQPTIMDVMENGTDDGASTETIRAPVDHYYRETPRSSLVGFLTFARANDFSRASEYLDLRYLEGEAASMEGAELARALKIVLDNKLWIDTQLLSDSPDGHQNDNLPPYRDLIGIIRSDTRIYQLWMQRVPANDGFLWKVSNRTVDQIPQLYAMYGYGPVEEYLSTHLPATRLFGAALWEWILAIAILVLAWLALKPVFITLALVANRLRPRLGEALTPVIKGPLHLWTALIVSSQLGGYFQHSLGARAIAQAGTLKIIVTAWLAMMLVTLAREYLIWRSDRNHRHELKVLFKPLATVLKILIVIAAALIWLSNIGFDVTTLIAGLGIGGLAIALGAQKSFENLIGTIILYSSAPLRVGDMCSVDGTVGKVEEIGLWSTRIRTLDRSVVFIPNSQLASGVIENLSLRDKFPFSRIVYLTHDTSREKIETVMDRIREILNQHELVDESLRRVHLENIGEFGFEVNVKAFIRTTNMTENKQTVAEINLAINNVIQEEGVAYAKPLLPRGQAQK